MKKWIIRIVSAFVVLLIVALAVAFFSLNTIVKRGVETVGPQVTKVNVTLGSAAISPFSGGGELFKLFVGNPEGYKTASAIQVGKVKVAVVLGSVMGDTIVVKEIVIKEPEITFEGGLAGNNISKLLDNVEGSPNTKEQTPPAAKKTAANGGKKFIVKDVTIEGAKLHASLVGLGGKEFTLPLPILHLQNIGTAEGGVTAGQLVKQILKPLLASITEAVAKDATGLGKNAAEIGKGATKQVGENVNKVTGGFKGLFKK